MQFCARFCQFGSASYTSFSRQTRLFCLEFMFPIFELSFFKEPGRSAATEAEMKSSEIKLDIKDVTCNREEFLSICRP